MKVPLFMFQTITKEFILSKISEEDIFIKYLGLHEIIEEVLIVNPLRADKNPTASFKFVKGKSGSDRLQFRDWSQSFSLDCFNVAQIVCRTDTYYDTLYKIAEDFNLINKSGKFNNEISIQKSLLIIRDKAKTEKLKIEILKKNFGREEKKFWNRWEVTEEQCRKFNVYALQNAWLSDSEGNMLLTPSYEYLDRDIGFGFYFGKGDWKLYFPLRNKKKVRFIQNCSNRLQGAHNLPEKGKYVLLTKSYKDVIVLDLFGVVAVAPMSETTIISQRQYEILISRFEQIFILFDNDRAGKKATLAYIKKYPKIIPLLFPKGEPKDFTDNLEIYGQADMIDQIEHIKMRFNV